MAKKYSDLPSQQKMRRERGEAQRASGQSQKSTKKRHYDGKHLIGCDYGTMTIFGDWFDGRAAQY